MKRLTKRLAAAVLTAGLALAAVITPLAASPPAGKESALPLAGTRAADGFLFPNEITRTGTVGVRVPVARITPADDRALDYRFLVLLGDREIPSDGYSFFPEAAGTYAVRYYCRVDGERREYAYTVAVTLSDRPVFSQTPVFPHAFVAGKTYALPQIQAADWSDGTRKEAEVTAAVRCGGDPIAVSGGKFTPTGSEAEIVYTASAGGKTETLTVRVPVTAVYDANGEVDTAGLFAARGFDSVAATDECVSLVTIGDAEARFANILGADGLTIEFGFGGRCAAESAVIKIESYDDPSVAVTLAFEKGKRPAGEGKLVLNGNAYKSHTFTAGERFTVGVDEARSRLVGKENALLFDLKTDLSGAAFSGFPGRRVKISLSLTGVYGETELKVYSVNSQLLTDARADSVLPTLSQPDMPGEFRAGDTVAIGAVYAVDVIDPNASVTVDALLDNVPLTDVNGRKLERVDASAPMSFVVPKAGTVMLRYTVADARNTYTYMSVLFVYDRTPPAIRVNGAVPSRVKPGETVELPGAEAEDNDGKAGLTIRLIVQFPSARTLQTAASTGTGTLDGRSFAFEAEGVYVVRYVAADAYGNYARQDFSVTVGD